MKREAYMENNVTGFFNRFPLLFYLSVAGCILAACLCSCSRKPQGEKVVREQRIASLAPNLTEMLFAIGAGSSLVGRTSACDYPPEASELPIVGGFGTPNVDSLVRVDPTLVLEVDLEDESVGSLIEKLGFKRERVKCSGLDDIPRAILKVGELANSRGQAVTLAESIRARVEELRSEAQAREESSEGPLVYVEIWSDPLMTAGRGSFVSDIVSLAGGNNIGDEVLDREYFSVSPEWVIARDPDIIICLYMTDAQTIGSILGKRVGWSRIKAVREGKVYGGMDNSLMLRPGPRVLEGIESLRNCIKQGAESS